MFTYEMFIKLRRYFPYINGIGGHTVRHYFEYERVIQSKEVKYLTFIREPISRYLSHYHYQKNVMGIDWTLESFSESNNFRNYQTKKIAGYEDLNVTKKIISKNMILWVY